MAKSAMDCVKLARDAKRPHLKDFIDLICSDFEELHGDRLVNDDRGLVGGFATIRAGEKASDKDVKVLIRESGRIPQGDAPREARREVPPSRRDVRGHSRRVSRQGGGGARAGRGDREVPRVLLAPQDASRGRGDRRGRVWRRARDCGRRQDTHDGERGLFGDLSRRLRGDPLARRDEGARGGGGAQDHRSRPPEARRDRRSREGARGRSAEEPQGRRERSEEGRPRGAQGTREGSRRRTRRAPLREDPRRTRCSSPGTDTT